MTSPRSYDANLRSDLVATAARAVSASGTEAVSLRAVAAEARTTTAGIYALFPSRAALLREAVLLLGEQLQERVRARGTDVDPAEDLVLLGAAYREAAVADPHGYRAVTREREAWRIHLGDEPVDLPALVARLRGPDAGEHDATRCILTAAALVHGLIVLEIDNVLPEGEDERAASFRRALEELAASLSGGR